MDGTSSMLDEVRTIFGSMPKVFERMHEADELEQRWPSIRAVLVEPAPLSPAVVQALFIIFSVRCANSYCFVLHMLTLSTMGATPVSLSKLSQLFDMPEVEPDHQRWSRLLKLAWLSHADGPQQRAADFLLRRECSEAEYQQIHAVYRANEAINSFTVGPILTLDGEPMIDNFPLELRALVPELIQFHMRTDGANPQTRPVATMCSGCRQVRAVDGQWYPHEAVDALLAKNVLFSHGLCSSCQIAAGIPSEADGLG